ncbi:hypothetical protein N7468_004294 [Penicillium chermesinum]|uniref:PNPLA domain-containing protein n=1 Tax=Penicillium chermesinum TaxID=63820 RepID=A0A9W9P875_9EURO|nr:uncharacterized protein N7468_004294 [Penicillium chermesinum]KAJ5239675.1 hypothetical protein N7468_004294 [Penicillium chermesinum]
MSYAITFGDNNSGLQLGVNNGTLNFNSVGNMQSTMSGAGDSSSGMGLRLLSLDGGGVRGFSIILIIRNLMERIDRENPPAPCRYFDLIGGTSTGGLIAIMLGRMRMTIKECEIAYRKLLHVFTPVRGDTGTYRFDHRAFEHAIKIMLVDHGMDPECLLQDPSAEACKTFVCATSEHLAEKIILSSYWNERRGGELFNETKLWEAARATCAAIGLFEPITICEESFVDGQTGTNNPVQETWAEAADIWQLNNGRLRYNVQCLVSIGTGIPGYTAFAPSLSEVAKTLKAIAMETEETADRFRRHYTDLFQARRAFRFTVGRGLNDVGLEDLSKLSLIKAATRNYLRIDETSVEMRHCVERMEEGGHNASFA